MPNLATELNNDNNLIELRVVNGVAERKDKVKYNKDGSVCKIKNHKQSGKESSVYPFKSVEEVRKVIEVLNSHIESATNEEKRQIAYRNKLLCVVGMNIGIRASDLRLLKWSFFLNDDMTFKEFYSLCPKKTSNKHKFVKLYFNNTVKKSILDYLEEYPTNDLNEYMFASRKGDKPITPSSLGRIVKDTADEANIVQNIGSHSLRKTWGFMVWHNANDKQKALVTLQQCFNHSSQQTTLKYIGILDEEIKDMYESVEIGLDFI